MMAVLIEVVAGVFIKKVYSKKGSWGGYRLIE